MRTPEQIKREIKKLNTLQTTVQAQSVEWKLICTARDTLFFALNQNASIAIQIESYIQSHHETQQPHETQHTTR